MGDPNASIPTPQPVHYRPMFAALRPRASTSAGHLRHRAPRSKPASRERSASTRPLVAVGTRAAASPRQSMVHNDATPKIEVDPETYEVRADGELLTCEPATVLPMAQRYFLF